MTRHLPSNWTTPSRLAGCLLVLGGVAGCGLNKAPEAEQKAAGNASTASQASIQTVGFISAAAEGAAPADAWQPAVESESIQLLPLPPIDGAACRSGQALPRERAEDVFGVASNGAPLQPLPAIEHAPQPAGALQGRDLSGHAAAAAPHSAPSAPIEPMNDDASLVDLSAPIPVFSTIELAPFEVADDAEHEALAPRVRPPSPAHAANLPAPNLAGAIRGEKARVRTTREEPSPAANGAATQLAKRTPEAPAESSGGDQEPVDSQLVDSQPIDSTTAELDSNVAASDHGGTASADADSAEPPRPEELAVDALATTASPAEPQRPEAVREPGPASQHAPSDATPDALATTIPPADAWSTTPTPTTPTPTTPTPTSADVDRLSDYADAPRALHPVATGVPTGAKINQQAVEKIRRGYALAQRGAYYSARSEFVGVLRMLAQGKDHLTGQPRRSRALAAGLRALDEVRDFAPTGGALDADVDLSVITSSHRTPVAKTDDDRLPQQLMDVYFRYAQVQLGASVAGEPAGSMALHALGKLHSQLGRVEPEQHPLAKRFAYSYQQAALLAHNQNHLAAHELGVLMAESGHYREAEDLLQQVASREPHPQVLQNLARVQQQLGHVRMAAETKEVAAQMRTRYGSANGISWVDPSVFSRQSRPNWQEPAPPRVAEGPAKNPTR